MSIIGSADDFGVVGAIARGRGHYEPQVMALLSRLVRRDDVCLDVGANIGIMTVLLGKLCVEGHVWAFEPSTVTRDYLSRNVSANGLSNVTVDEHGLYDATGVASLQLNASHPGGAYVSETEAREADAERIELVTLDDWVSAEHLDRIDVIKMDIEGAELHALRGAMDTLHRFRPALVVECNPVALRRFHRARAGELLELLRSVYTDLFWIDGHALRPLQSEGDARTALDRHGIIDVAAGDRVKALSSAVSRRFPVRRKVKDMLHRARSRSRPDSQGDVMNFVHEPNYVARFDVNRFVGNAGTSVEVSVHVSNTSRYVYSSSFPNHPVCASYRILSGDGLMVECDGIRTFFREPLRPGATATLDMLVALPDKPGDYLLSFSLVQEAFAWFDELDPALAFTLPLEVR